MENQRLNDGFKRDATSINFDIMVGVGTWNHRQKKIKPNKARRSAYERIAVH